MVNNDGHDEYAEFPEGPAGTIHEPPRKVKDLSRGRKKVFRVQFCVLALAHILVVVLFFVSLLVPGELFYIRAAAAVMTLALLEGLFFVCYIAVRRNFIFQEQVYGPAVPGAYAIGTVPSVQGANIEELMAKQIERQEKAQVEWEKQEGEMKKRLDDCFADFCGGVKGFDRKKAGECVGCRYKMDCMMATQQRVMQKFYKEHRRGDDWQNDED